jgi:hypothetical protein
MVETKHFAETLEALDWADGGFVAAIRRDQSVLEPLMVPLHVVMSGELPCRLPERSLSEEDHPIEAFVRDGPHRPLDH